MKQMTKEELIEYFIEQLGDNRILGKYFSIEEIRTRLNKNIQLVSYEKEEGNIFGHYNDVTKTINIDLKKHTPQKLKETIVHELLHALSFSEWSDEKTKVRKSGFFYKKTFTEDKIQGTGFSINEGITQLLTEQILSLDTNASPGYELEKDVTRLLFGIIGRENMIDFYFSESKSFEEMNQVLNNLFLYNSPTTTSNISNSPSIMKIFALSEQLAAMKYNANGVLEADQLEAYNKIRAQLCDYINDFLIEELTPLNPNNEPTRKREILEALVQFHSISTNIPYKEPSEILADIIFENEDIKGLSNKISLYKNLAMGRQKPWHSRYDSLDLQMAKHIEDYCIANGIIDRGDFPKFGMLYKIFMAFEKDLSHTSDVDIKALLSNFSYTKVGELYELHYHGIDSAIIGAKTDRVLFYKNGSKADVDKMHQFEFYGDTLQTTNIPFEYDEGDEYELQLRRQILKIAEASDKKFKLVRVLGKDVIMYYYEKGIIFNGDSVLYSIDDNGNFVSVKKDEPKRLIDDVEESKIHRGFGDRVINSLIGHTPESKKYILGSYIDFEHENISMTEMIELIRKLSRDYALKSLVLDELQEFYIPEGDFSKRHMLGAAAILVDSPDDQADINKFYYKQVGSHYELCYNEELTARAREFLMDELYGIDGVKISSSNVISVYQSNTPGNFKYIPIKRIDDDLLEKIKRVNEISGNSFSKINILGNDIIFRKHFDNGKIISVTYTLNENGELELSPSTIPRRLLDDMSELDIQLMQETQEAGITVTDMLETAKKMNPKERKIDDEKTQ